MNGHAAPSSPKQTDNEPQAKEEITSNAPPNDGLEHPGDMGYGMYVPPQPGLSLGPPILEQEKGKWSLRKMVILLLV